MNKKSAVGSGQWAVAVAGSATAAKPRAVAVEFQEQTMPLRALLPTAHCPPLTASSLQPPASSLRAGISLLEVLISMFVLLFGLMGVAAIFPVGNHYAGRGEQYDRATALSTAAFAELKARGMLRPQFWYYAPNSAQPNVIPNKVSFKTRTDDARFTTSTLTFNAPLPTNQTFPAGPGHAFVIDPLGAAAGRTAGLTGLDIFPYGDFSGGNPSGAANNAVPAEWQSGSFGVLGDRWPIRRVTLAQAGGLPLSPPVAAAIFDLRDDLTVELPKQGDRPGIQRWETSDVNPANGNVNNTPEDPRDDTLLARKYTGSYTWLATVVPADAAGLAALQPSDPQYGNALYDVSVAVFHKREITPSAASERSIMAELAVGGELVFVDEDNPNDPEVIDAALDGVRSGQWIALAGVHPTTGQFLLKWYRLLALDDETETNVAIPGHSDVAMRRAMVEGPEWPTLTPGAEVHDLRAIVLPGVISVTTQTVAMEQAE